MESITESVDSRAALAIGKDENLVLCAALLKSVGHNAAVFIDKSLIDKLTVNKGRWYVEAEYLYIERKVAVRLVERDVVRPETEERILRLYGSGNSVHKIGELLRGEVDLQAVEGVLQREIQRVVEARNGAV